MTDNDRAEYLRNHIRPGDTIYTIERHKTMSPNGNSSHYFDVLIVWDGTIRRVTPDVATVLNRTWSDKYECIKAPWPGSGIGFYLSRALWPHASANKPLIVEEL